MKVMAGRYLRIDTLTLSKSKPKDHTCMHLPAGHLGTCSVLQLPIHHHGVSLILLSKMIITVPAAVVVLASCHPTLMPTSSPHLHAEWCKMYRHTLLCDLFMPIQDAANYHHCTAVFPYHLQAATRACRMGTFLKSASGTLSTQPWPMMLGTC